ncbi:protocatechuate 3,4-dioxygenase subunit alpha [uncultured Amnibacterium sp.]|uniref:protocatechuate 3,4-dioxygenase subunit alpha n=1 Tax=uncultured Amnibacterium sp. TaxID=1631851 RepID=UPI0035CBD380
MTSERLRQTPSQTVGPFFGYALPFPGGAQLVPAGAAGAITVHGTVTDGEGEPIPDALLEWWQPDAAGRISQRDGSRARELGRFTGFGRITVDLGGHYELTTLLPGAVAPSTAPWALVTVFARGLLHHLFTRAYLVGADDPVPADPLLDRIDPARRETLLARADGPSSYRFDLRLQGDRETVFLDYAEPV